MTALAIQREGPPPGPALPEPGAWPDAHAWIEIDAAARAMSVTAAHLRRRKCPAWSSRGLAVKHDPGDGRARWFVARVADAAFAEGEMTQREQRVAALSGVGDMKRDEALTRAACVEAYRAERKRQPGPERQWMPSLLKRLGEQHPEIKLSKTTLRRWSRKYRGPSDLIELIDTRGQHRHDHADPACWAHFRSIYLDPNEPSLAECWRLTRQYAIAEGLAWCSESQCRQRLDDKVTPAQQAKYRRPRAYRERFSPYVEQDPEAVAVGEEWQGDHCILDVMCSVPGRKRPVRPWLTAWLDTRSRRVVGWSLNPEAPSTTPILAAFRMAVLDPTNGGPPQRVLIDNGKDYDSYALHGMSKVERKRLPSEVDRFRIDPEATRGGGVFRLLGVEAHFAAPYSPQRKGRIERWFGTMHSQFDKRWATYTGRDVDHKPEGLAATLRQPHKVPSFDAVLGELRAFIDDYNAAASMRVGAEGQSPDEMMATRVPRPIENPAALDFCLQLWHKPVKVTRNGVRIEMLGRGLSYGQYHADLRPLIGTGDRVIVSYDPNDLSLVWVHRWTPDGGVGPLIARVPINDRLGGGGVFSKADLAEQLKARAEVRKADRVHRRQGLRHAVMTPEQLAAQDRADREAAERQAAIDAAPKPAQPAVEQPSIDEGDDDELDIFKELAAAPVPGMKRRKEIDPELDRQLDAAMYGDDDDRFTLLRKIEDDRRLLDQFTGIPTPLTLNPPHRDDTDDDSGNLIEEMKKHAS
ncbi:MAG: Mu transposase C-terminal domain-containing protein [Planctomycetota bacterium]